MVSAAIYFFIELGVHSFVRSFCACMYQSNSFVYNTTNLHKHYLHDGWLCGDACVRVRVRVCTAMYRVPPTASFLID